MKNKKVVLNVIPWIFIGMFICSCNAGSNKQSSTTASSYEVNKTAKHVLKSTSQSLPYTMGGTYDTTTGYPTSAISCLNAGESGNYTISDPKAVLDLTEAQSLQEVLNALSISMAITVGWGPFAVTETYNYAHSSQNNAYTLNFNYIYKYAGTALFPYSNLMQGESALTPSARAVLNTPQQFRQMCGNRFIAQMDAGASVLMRMQLQFWSEEDKNYFETHLQKVGGLDTILNDIAANKGDTHYKLIAAGVQVGGNPQLLNNLFINAGGSIDPKNGYPTIDCSNGNGVSAKCAGLVNSIINYSSSIESQIASPGGLSLSNPVTAPWSSIGIQTGNTNPTPAILAALNNITTLFNEDQKTADFLFNYSNMLYNNNLLSPNMYQDIMNSYNVYQQIIDIYYGLDMMNCYGAYASNQCVSINNSLISQRNQIISQNQALYNFVDYLKHNQYQTRLLIGSKRYDTAYCGLYPISSVSRALFLINCNGQVSGNIGTDTGIQMINNINTLTVNNFNYSYINESGLTNNFSYLINGDLEQEPQTGISYYTYSDVDMNNNTIANNRKLTIVRKFFY